MITDQTRGNVGFGVEDPQAKLSVGGKIYGEANSLLGAAVHGKSTCRGTRPSFGGDFEAPGTASSGVRASGGQCDFYATGPWIDYRASSSKRRKENVVTIAQPLRKVVALRGVHFDWANDHGGHHYIGFIAEEAGEISPEIVDYEEISIDAIGLDYCKLSPPLVEAVKALVAENDLLKPRLEAIVNKLNDRHGPKIRQINFYHQTIGWLNKRKCYEKIHIITHYNYANVYIVWSKSRG